MQHHRSLTKALQADALQRPLVPAPASGRA